MIKPKNYHIGIKALIVQNGKVLALKDVNRYQGYDLPGGKVDEGETIDKALERELNEELGITEFKVGELVHVYERFDYKEKDISLMLICFKVYATITDITLSHEHTSFDWLSKDDLVNMKKASFRNPQIKIALEKALE